MNYSFLPSILPLFLTAGLMFSHASSEIGNFDRKILNSDGSSATGAKVIVIHRNVERSGNEVVTTGVTDAQGMFSGSAAIPEHWDRVLASTIVLGAGSQVAFECKYYHRDKIAEAHWDIILTESTALKTRIIGVDGKPIPGVRLRIEQLAGSVPGRRIPFSQPIPALPGGLWSGVSDSEGRCVIDRVPPDLRFYLTHDDPSLAQASGGMNIHVSWKTPVSDGDEYEILLVQPGSVSGRILLPDGSPVGNAEININETSPYDTSYRSSARTDDEGRFHIPSVPPSAYRFRIELPPAWEAQWISAEFPPVEIGDETPTMLPDITLVKAAEVTAEIVDSVSGKTIEEPLIVRLPPGSHDIHYRSHRMPPEGYLEGKHTIRVDVEAGDRKRIVFRMDPVTDDHLVTGKVVDGNGEPVPDIAVALLGTGSWGMSPPVRTDSEGRFQVAQEEELQGGFVIASNGVDAVSKKVRAEPGEEAALVLQKSGFAKISVTVRDEEGNPIRKAKVRLSQESLNPGFHADRLFGTIIPEPAQTDKDGNFLFEGVWVGLKDYWINASAEGFGDASSRGLNFPADTTDEVSLTLKSAGESLTGTVVDAEGVPVAGAWVNCDGDAQPGRFGQVFTDEEGRFVLEPLTRGTVYLKAGKYDADSSRDVSAKAQVPGDPVRLVLPVADGVVSGKVVDADGSPVAGAEVSASFRNRKTISDETGDFRITGLMAGWFEIEAKLKSGSQTETIAEERTKPGTEDIILHLEPEKPAPQPRPEEPLDLIGTLAPDIDVETWFNSEPHSAKAGGKVRILDFWGLQCAPCIANMPKIAKFWDAAPQDKLEIIALTGYYHDDEISEFLAKHPGYKFSFAKYPADATTYRDYDIRGIPTYVVISKDGIIVSYGHDWEKASAAAMSEIKKE